MYALVDPRVNTVRYIGQTTRTLPDRLAGHVVTTVPNVNAWVAELAAADAQPEIVPLYEGVPVGDLRTAERNEITRRLVAGEDLLNEASTAAARKILQLRADEARKERLRCAWEDVAHMTRTAIGGPLPPGDLPLVPFPAAVWEGIEGLRDVPRPTESVPTDSAELALALDLMTVQGKFSDVLWRLCRSAWSFMRASLHDSEDEVLQDLVRSMTQARWDSAQDASRYLSLMPWLLLAVRPWASLAAEAQLALESPEFIPWVSDDPQVQEPLRFIAAHTPDVFETLGSDTDQYDDTRTAKYLAVLGAAHGRFALPEVLHGHLVPTLRAIARQKMLTPPMAALLAALDPGALNQVFGRDLAAETDAALGLPPGTAVQVLAYLLEHPPADTGSLDRVVARAAGVLPSRPYPDYDKWTGRSVRSAQVAVATLVHASLLDPPDNSSAEALLDEIRGLWTMDADWLGNERHGGAYPAA